MQIKKNNNAYQVFGSQGALLPVYGDLHSALCRAGIETTVSCVYPALCDLVDPTLANPIVCTATFNRKITGGKWIVEVQLPLIPF